MIASIKTTSMPLFVVLKYQTVNADVYDEKVKGVNCHIKYCQYCPYGYQGLRVTSLWGLFLINKPPSSESI